MTGPGEHARRSPVEFLIFYSSGLGRIGTRLAGQSEINVAEGRWLKRLVGRGALPTAPEGGLGPRDPEMSNFFQ
jgi:hypothetical protein